MRRRSDSTSYPFSVFTPEFLRYPEGFDEPVTAAEADMAGPFRIEAAPDGGFAVMRPGHSLSRGDEPEGFFFRIEHALQIAAILPAAGRDDRFTLHTEQTSKGHAVLSHGEVVGYLRWFNSRITDGLHLTDCVLRTPDSLGRLLRAAGGLALLRADDILLERLFIQQAP